MVLARAMQIKIPGDLPAFRELEEENIFVMTEERAFMQDIRPLRIAILNLMPTKTQTEIQFLRLLSNTPLQIDISLFVPSTHESKTTSIAYLKRFYRSFNEIKDEYFDGMIVTGAPLEKLDFRDVDFWDEMCEIMDWSRTHVFSTMYICWAAIAALYHLFGVEKTELGRKRSGVYEYTNALPREPLMRGIDPVFRMPQSRFATVSHNDVCDCKELRIAASSGSDVAILISDLGDVFITGHLEYDAGTLEGEYWRDYARGMHPDVPENYFRNDDPNHRAELSWRSYSTLIFTNWVNYYVYQRTPYNIKDVKKRLERK